MNTATLPITASKTTLLDALDTFVRQRPGLEYGNYGDFASYSAEVRSITKQLRDFRQLARAVEHCGITGDDLIEAAKHSYSGRLSFVTTPKGVAVDYCTGQYFPTEYRAAACAVLASALWSHVRESYPHYDGDGIRAHFKRWFGLGIQRRWFN